MWGKPMKLLLGSLFCIFSFLGFSETGKTSDLMG